MISFEDEKEQLTPQPHGRLMIQHNVFQVTLQPYTQAHTQ